MKSASLARTLSLFDATMLVIGCIVGVGIFRTASAIAGQVPSPAWILALWAAGGVVSLCGALCYAELSSMFPASGGDYVYIREVYGRFWAFLFGWTKLFIERTGTIAILGFVFAEYFRKILPYDDLTLRLTAAGAIVALTAVNVIGLRWGTLVQNSFTVVKIAALLGLIAAGAWAWLARNTVQPAWTLSAPVDAPSLALAFVFVLWTYGGWTEAAYVAEEVREPTRNVPQAIVQGVLLTTVLYVLVNWSYLLFVPVESLPKTPLVAAWVAQDVLGARGAVVMAGFITCSAFGALNGYILTGGRILFAMGRDFPALAKLGMVDARFHTPARALWVNAAIAAVLVFTKTLDQIMTYSTVVISLFFMMAVVAVFVLRRREPQRARPYRTWGYPVTPLIFCLTIAGFIGNVWIKEPKEALFGFAFLAVGLPLYWLSARR